MGRRCSTALSAGYQPSSPQTYKGNCYLSVYLIIGKVLHLYCKLFGFSEDVNALELIEFLVA